MSKDNKIRSILRAVTAGFIAGFIFLVLLPYLLAEINNILNWTVLKYSFLEAIGVFLIIFGVGMFIYCSELFNRLGQGTPAPIEPPEKLVAQGIYKYTRNPMYLGYFAIVFGEFLFFGHILLGLYSLFVVVFISFYLIFWEEPELKKRFGDNYKRYKQEVPRWFNFKFN
ncbi:MAG: methyltransferase family protein [Patescibacteria group bacterium]